MSVTGVLVRFIGAGTIVALLPWVATRFGPGVAGVLLLFPVVTMGGLYVIGTERGHQAVADAASSSVVSLLAVAAFLLTVSVVARRGPVLAALLIGLAAWLATAACLTFMRRR